MRFVTKHILVAMLILGTLVWLHVSLISKTFVVDGNGAIHTAIAGYGDIPLHLTQITKFAFRMFNLDDPIFYGEKLYYPFLINLLSGALLRLTGFWTFAVLAPIIFLLIANIILAFFIYSRIVKRKLLAATAVVLFLLGSGLGGWRFIKHAYQEKMTPIEFAHWLTDTNASTTTRWDAKWPEQNIAFGAPLSLVLIHQRPFFLGMFLFLLLCLLVLDQRTAPTWKKTIFAGIVFGIMPLAHTHSFVAAAVVLAICGIGSVARKDWVNLKHYLVMAMIAAVFAVPQMLFLMGSKSIGSGFFAFRYGWMVEPTIGSVVVPSGEMPHMFSFPYISFLWMNFGIILPLFIVSSFVLLRNKILQWIVSGSALFLAVQFIRFQPWDYDDNKLLVYWQFFAAGLIVVFIDVLLQKNKKTGLIILAATLILGIGSGIIDQIPRVLASRDNLPSIAGIESRELANFLEKNIPEDTLILTGTSHLNPIAMLSGRQMLVGYPGWLWTRGIDYGERARMIENFYSHPSEKHEIFSRYPIKYILIDDQVINEKTFSANVSVFDGIFWKIFENSRYKLYKI